MLLVFDLSGTLIDARGRLYEGAHTFLVNAKAQGFQLAVATNLGRQGMLGHLRDEGIENLFDSLQCAGVHPFKPAPDMLVQAMLETGIDAAHTIMIGDSTGDMQMAKTAGTKACAAVWGDGVRSQLIGYQPDFIAESFSELSKLLDIACPNVG